MNLSVREVGAALLVVPQFTLAADTDKGTRAGFSTAAPPEQAQRLFAYLLECRVAPMPLFPLAYLGRTCRCPWSTTGR